MKEIYFKPQSELTFESVIDVRKSLIDLLANTWTHLNLDLSAVTHCDSAGMALLIEIIKLCKNNNRILHISGITSATYSLAVFYGVKDILAAVSFA